MMDKNIMVDGSAVVWEEVLEFVGSMVCLDGECKTCDRTQNSSSQQMSSKVETCVEFSMAPQIVAVEHHKEFDVAGPSSGARVSGRRSRHRETKLRVGAREWWRMLLDVKKPPGMELGQWWRLWHRTGHRWIEKCNMNVVVAIRDRMLSWAGHEARLDLQRNLGEGSEMSRPSMVEMETTPLERNGERQMVWPTPTAFQNLQVGGHGCWGGLQVCWKRRWSVEN